MRHHLLALAALLVGVGCAAQGTLAETTENPHHFCRKQGIESGTDAFRDCIDNSIVQQCTAAGLAPKSAGFARCERRLRDMVLVTQVLEMRGYPVDFELYRFN